MVQEWVAIFDLKFAGFVDLQLFVSLDLDYSGDLNNGLVRYSNG